ncbi:unnamed protein product [Brugia pahangi]|uniref:Uncharacterized protein n=1 Tax=Brugia pahangi TaxID=6280 RepID=A0A158PSG1_BRUPA|nr:unnamed protein product [Brugia pahangi]
MITATITNNFLFVLFYTNIAKIHGELNYDLPHYNIQQQQPNIPFQMTNNEMRPGFRLKKIALSDQQRAQLSWLAANTETNDQRSRTFRLISKQPQQLLSTNHINNNNYYYHHKLSLKPTLSPIYYASNLRTIPPMYYYHDNYLSPTFTQPIYLPAMMTAIRNIISILQKTMYPTDNTDIDYNTTTRGIIKDANLSNNNSQLPQSSTPSSLSLSSSSSSLSLSLPSSSSSFLLSSSPSATATGKVEEVGVTLKSGNDGGIETGKIVNVEEMKGTGIREVKEIEDLIDSNFYNIFKTKSITTFATTTTTTTTATTTTTSIDDGSNLLGSLLSGRLDKINWFESLFGFNHLPTKEEGSAVAQIFEGGIFGPAS